MGWRCLWATGDWHIGHAEHRRGGGHRLLRRHIRYAEANADFVLLMGDLCEMATLAGTRVTWAVHEQEMKPDEQLAEIIGLLEPVAGKVVGYLWGNHESRVWKATALNPLDILKYACPRIEDLGLGSDIVFDLGKQQYRICATHGYSAARNIWLEMDRLRLAWPGCDVYLAGHNHACAHRTIVPVSSGLVVSPKETRKAARETSRPIWLARTGNFLGYANYARQAMYQPEAMGSAWVWMNTSRRQVIIYTGDQPETVNPRKRNSKKPGSGSGGSGGE